MVKIAIDYSDGVIKASEKINNDILQYVSDAGVKTLECLDDNFAESYVNFYENL